MNIVKNKNEGFTLVEIIVAMTIVVIFAMMMIGILNAIGITNKGRDAQRKKDLYRIKVAFEEYFNDRGYFPQDTSSWNIKSNCGKNIVAFPNLQPWPCDPNRETYKILVETNKFRIVTNLENKKDKDIPDGWYDRTDFNLAGWTKDDINYGVSSTNILWYETTMAVNPDCDASECSRLSNDGTGCVHVNYSIGCSGSSCYFRANDGSGRCLSPQCQTDCCGPRCY